ncbi:uncharacterized protein LOC121406910 [Lytechinus variegatus]|uniref:uncharacterized protein LOC121406910 n=1 Tax=Lytechinus variegatus TaxID=7654 RepID=UPI001BB2A92A|nr:uncharacterized protein LOC121406910 [Lytechinus variegatus]
MFRSSTGSRRCKYEDFDLVSFYCDQLFARPMYNPMGRLKRICPYYNYEKIDEGYGFCNWKVLKEVYEKDRDWNRDRYMLTLFRMARDMRLCSSSGADVVQLRDPCAAFEHICNLGRTVDLCERIRQAMPPSGPSNTPRPNTPPGPPGGGV